MKYEAARNFALSLPEVAEAPHHQLGSFRVRGRIFATVPPERDRLHLFLSETDRELALAVHPQFAEKLFWGTKVAGVRIVLARAEPAAVERLIRQAWEHKAPRALVAALDGSGTRSR